MAYNFISPIREQQLLLSPNLKDWLPEDHPVRFFIKAVCKMNITVDDFKVNETGCGRPQYDPIMMLTLYLYCSTRGIRSSRKIEMATYDSVAVRYLTGDLHPDHDTIAVFRKSNQAAIAKAFLEILNLAKAVGMLTLGEISLDSTQIKANASKQKNYRIDRAVETEKYYQGVIDSIMNQSEAADSAPDADRFLEGKSEQEITEEIEKAQRKIEEAAKARRNLEKRAQEAHEKEIRKYNKKREANEKVIVY